MKKKTVLIHSNFSRAFTGFGKHKKNLLLYLHNTGKYNVVEAANGQFENSPAVKKLPWKCYGTMPNNFEVLEGEAKREAGYGMRTIDGIIKEVKPDVYIGIEDIWAFGGYASRPWWNKINSVIWTTLDSLPILQQAIDFAPVTKHYFVWASFAEKAFKEMGYDNVKTLRGCLDTEHFFPFSKEDKLKLRQDHGINPNDFIIGFVFRNQLRKSVPNLLEGFVKFKEINPNAKLLLHTHWPEAWDIPRLMDEMGIHSYDVLTTYHCRACHNYRVMPFIGERKQCPSCGTKGSFNTTNIGHGVSEGQLNEVYNMMDVYCHPFTSGGQEIPVQEAKLAGLVTLVTNYSCGEDNCTPESGGLPLDWEAYREPGTQFIKSSTLPSSITERLEQVQDMSEEGRGKMGQKARQWVLDNFSIGVVGKQVEEMLDAMPEVDWDFDMKPEPAFPNAKFEEIPHESDVDFMIRLYKTFMNQDVDKNFTGVKIWMKRLELKEIDRPNLVNHFRQSAAQHNQQSQKIELGDVLDGDDPDKRIAVVCGQGETDLFFVNSLLGNLAQTYPNHDIYVFTQPELFQYVEDNPNCHKCLRYTSDVENPQLLEGQAKHKGFFKLAFFPQTTTHRFTCYIHNGKQKNQFKVKR